MWWLRMRTTTTTTSSLRRAWPASTVLAIPIIRGTIPGMILGTTTLGTMVAGAIVLGAGMVAGTMVGMALGTMVAIGVIVLGTMAGVTIMDVGIMVATGPAIVLIADSTAVEAMPPRAARVVAPMVPLALPHALDVQASAA